MSKLAKKKKKKSRYKRGLHVSPVAGECKYRSSWEFKYMMYLDANTDVATWSYEKIIIEYVSNQKSKKIRKYYPDFLVEFKDGSKKLVEIKQKRKLQQATVKKKALAARAWCVEHGATYELLTEIELKNMGLI